MDALFMYLQTYANVRLYERESLVVLDEVQLFPQAREFVKHLVADRRYDYLETGSPVSIKANVEGIVIPSEEDGLSLDETFTPSWRLRQRLQRRACPLPL